MTLGEQAKSSKIVQVEKNEFFRNRQQKRKVVFWPILKGAGKKTSQRLHSGILQTLFLDFGVFIFLNGGTFSVFFDHLSFGEKLNYK